MMDPRFYDELAPFYHLIYGDWEASIARQAANLESIVRERWGERARTILDVSCGIGTQAIGLAQRGFLVTASDLSPGAVERARNEARARGVEINFSVADMREVFDHHGRTFDVVISCDNSIPHLLSDEEIQVAFDQIYKSTSPGGGCIISVRDYAAMDLQGIQVHPFGVRVEGDSRYLVFQVWEFQGPIYDLSMYLIKDAGGSDCRAMVMRSKYYAVSIEKLIALLAKAGFEDVQRLDGRFFQPIIVGTKPASVPLLSQRESSP